MIRSLSKDIARAAKLLAKSPDVVSVGWGWRRSGGRWVEQPALSARVQRKSTAAKVDPKRHIAAKVGGVAVDVLATGTFVTHATLDTADHISVGVNHAKRTSAVSAFAEDANHDILMLMSGHGTLPVEAGEFPDTVFADRSVPWVRLVDDDATFKVAAIRKGAVNGVLDHAVAVLPGLTSDDVLLGHVMAPAPIRIRSAPLEFGARLLHFSQARGRTIAGILVQQDAGAAEGGRVVALDGTGASVTYEGVLFATPVGGESAFSVAGDSGSLVFDEHRHAVGVTVAGSEDGLLSCILPLSTRFQEWLGADFASFFEGGA